MEARDADIGTEPSFEDGVVEGLSNGAIATALAGLDTDLQAVLRATVIDGLSTKETARLLGIPRGTVKARAMRARNRMRELLI